MGDLISGFVIPVPDRLVAPLQAPHCLTFPEAAHPDVSCTVIASTPFGMHPASRAVRLMPGFPSLTGASVRNRLVPW
ncbi:MAG: hypothetical protein OXI87_17425 [Albidovulum sp.]|nr:hypothetical protein [Albidovulum sp.]